MDATCWPQISMEVKVSNPLKRSHVEIPFEASLNFVSPPLPEWFTPGDEGEGMES